MPENEEAATEAVAVVTAENIGEKTIEELLAFYNANVRRKLKKFADLPTAVAKVTALFDTIAAEAAAVAQRIEAGMSNPRSAGVSESWKDPIVAAKRKERNRVDVDGIVYKSVGDAFRQLGLDMKHCIKFRQELKAAGTDTEWGHVWTIMPGDTVVTAPKAGAPATPRDDQDDGQDDGQGDGAEGAEGEMAIA